MGISLNQQWIELTYQTFLNLFLHSGIIQPPTQEKKLLTSEGQAYGMWAAFLMNDQPTFETLWQTTQHHLQVFTTYEPFYTKANGERARKMAGANDFGPQTVRHNLAWAVEADGTIHWSSATDADVLIAYLLIEAGRQWPNTTYFQAGLALMNSIWAWMVDEHFVQDKLILVMSSRLNGLAWGPDWREISFGYFCPFALRTFAYTDPNRDHRWMDLLIDSYGFFTQPTAFAPSGLPYDFLRINPNGVVRLSERADVLQKRQNDFTPPAARGLLMMAYDVVRHDFRRPNPLFEQTTDKLLRSVGPPDKVPGRIKTKGTREGRHNLAMAAILLISLETNDPTIRRELAFKDWLSAHMTETGFRQPPTDYFNYFLAWLALWLRHQWDQKQPDRQTDGC